MGAGESEETDAPPHQRLVTPSRRIMHSLAARVTRADAVAAAEATERPHTPPSASSSLAPVLGSASIGSAVVQGRGRPRGQPWKLSGGGSSNPSPPPRFGGNHGDSLSTLLGGDMRGPGSGRGLSSGPGSFRSKLPVAAVLDSDDDDDIDMY